MAELTTHPTPTAEPAATGACCSSEVQAACCEPSETAACCEITAGGGDCGCTECLPTATEPTVRTRKPKEATA